jgi:hypothetical protein
MLIDTQLQDDEMIDFQPQDDEAIGPGGHHRVPVAFDR